MVGSKGGEFGTWAGLPVGARVLVDTAPIIYVLERNQSFAPLFEGLFEAASQGNLTIVLSVITLAEVLSGPFKSKQLALAKKYERALRDYEVVEVSIEIASLAAQLRSRYGLKLPDAIQIATALESDCQAVVTHDDDFKNVDAVPIVRGA